MSGIRGKTAFISGAGRNIGRALAIEFAERGCNLVLNALSDHEACEETAETARRSGDVDILISMGDVGRREVLQKITAEALARFGTVDVVINNVGFRPHTPFLEMKDADWYRILDVNLNSAFHICRAFTPGMVERRWGRIVNITGMHAMKGYSGRAAVSVAKHGLWGLTKSLAMELGPEGITCNAISPGTIRTTKSDPGAAERMAKQVASIPLGRLGEPEDIAALAGFLCSPEGGFINGQMIASNGGVET